jgi:hypothetical protein
MRSVSKYMNQLARCASRPSTALKFLLALVLAGSVVWLVLRHLRPDLLEGFVVGTETAQSKYDYRSYMQYLPDQLKCRDPTTISEFTDVEVRDHTGARILNAYTAVGRSMLAWTGGSIIGSGMRDFVDSSGNVKALGGMVIALYSRLRGIAVLNMPEVIAQEGFQQWRQSLASWRERRQAQREARQSTAATSAVSEPEPNAAATAATTTEPEAEAAASAPTIHDIMRDEAACRRATNIVWPAQGPLEPEQREAIDEMYETMLAKYDECITEVEESIRRQAALRNQIETPTDNTGTGDTGGASGGETGTASSRTPAPAPAPAGSFKPINALYYL